MWLSLAGFALCVTIMFLIDWLSSLITFIVIFFLYLIVVYRKPDVNWGSSTQAQTYKTALTAAYRLQSISDHVKNYRPQVLVLAGSPHMRPPLVDLASLITKNNSLMVVGDVITVIALERPAIQQYRHQPFVSIRRKRSPTRVASSR